MIGLFFFDLMKYFGPLDGLVARYQGCQPTHDMMNGIFWSDIHLWLPTELSLVCLPCIGRFYLTNYCFKLTSDMNMTIWIQPPHIHKLWLEHRVLCNTISNQQSSCRAATLCLYEKRDVVWVEHAVLYIILVFEWEILFVMIAWNFLWGF